MKVSSSDLLPSRIPLRVPSRDPLRVRCRIPVRAPLEFGDSLRNSLVTEPPKGWLARAAPGGSQDAGGLVKVFLFRGLEGLGFRVKGLSVRNMFWGL